MGAVFGGAAEEMTLYETLQPQDTREILSRANPRLAKGVVSASEFGDKLADLIVERAERVKKNRSDIMRERHDRVFAYMRGLGRGITSRELVDSKFGKAQKVSKAVLLADLQALVDSGRAEYTMVPNHHARDKRLYFVKGRR